MNQRLKTKTLHKLIKKSKKANVNYKYLLNQMEFKRHIELIIELNFLIFNVECGSYFLYGGRKKMRKKEENVSHSNVSNYI